MPNPLPSDVAAASTPATWSPQEELAAYRQMLLIRRFEEKAGQLYALGLIDGFCHLSIGQEAVVTGIALAAVPGDQVIATYRHHGQMLAAGMDPNRIMAELAGRRSGYSGGKGGSMHMFCKELDYYGGHGIVGANVPLGAGIAFANAYHGNGSVCICYLGDRAADQGQVYETMNMAACWKLPMVFVIENNSGEAQARSLAERGQPFGIPGVRVDGMEVAAVRAAALDALARSRGGDGPMLLEMVTEPYRGHAAAAADGDSATRDPIALLRERLLGEGRVTPEELKAADAAIRDVVASAARFAQAEPEPDAAEFLSDVLA